jgi:hypothetical protein
MTQRAVDEGFAVLLVTNYLRVQAVERPAPKHITAPPNQGGAPPDWGADHAPATTTSPWPRVFPGL